MQLVQKLKQFERQLVFLKWGCSEEYGRINYVGFDFIEFEVLDTESMEYTEKVLVNVQLVLEVVVKGTDISRIIAEYSSRLPLHSTEH